MKSVLVLAYWIVVMAKENFNVQDAGNSPLPNHDAPRLTRHTLHHLSMIPMVWG
jgi:hypothetical protein